MSPPKAAARSDQQQQQRLNSEPHTTPRRQLLADSEMSRNDPEIESLRTQLRTAHELTQRHQAELQQLRHQMGALESEAAEMETTLGALAEEKEQLRAASEVAARQARLDSDEEVKALRDQLRSGGGAAAREAAAELSALREQMLVNETAVVELKEQLAQRAAEGAKGVEEMVGGGHTGMRMLEVAGTEDAGTVERGELQTRVKQLEAKLCEFAAEVRAIEDESDAEKQQLEARLEELEAKLCECAGAAVGGSDRLALSRSLALKAFAAVDLDGTSFASKRALLKQLSELCTDRHELQTFARHIDDAFELAVVGYDAYCGAVQQWYEVEEAASCRPPGVDKQITKQAVPPELERRRLDTIEELAQLKATISQLEAIDSKRLAEIAGAHVREEARDAEIEILRESAASKGSPQGIKRIQLAWGQDSGAKDGQLTQLKDELQRVRASAVKDRGALAVARSRLSGCEQDSAAAIGLLQEQIRVMALKMKELRADAASNTEMRDRADRLNTAECAQFAQTAARSNEELLAVTEQLNTLVQSNQQRDMLPQETEPLRQQLVTHSLEMGAASQLPEVDGINLLDLQKQLPLRYSAESQSKVAEAEVQRVRIDELEAQLLLLHAELRTAEADCAAGVAELEHQQATTLLQAADVDCVAVLKEQLSVSQSEVAEGLKEQISLEVELIEAREALQAAEKAGEQKKIELSELRAEFEQKEQRAEAGSTEQAKELEAAVASLGALKTEAEEYKRLATEYAAKHSEVSGQLQAQIAAVEQLEVALSHAEEAMLQVTADADSKVNLALDDAAQALHDELHRLATEHSLEVTAARDALAISTEACSAAQAQVARLRLQLEEAHQKPANKELQAQLPVRELQAQLPVREQQNAKAQLAELQAHHVVETITELLESPNHPKAALRRDCRPQVSVSAFKSEVSAKVTLKAPLVHVDMLEGSGAMVQQSDRAILRVISSSAESDSPIIRADERPPGKVASLLWTHADS